LLEETYPVDEWSEAWESQNFFPVIDWQRVSAEKSCDEGKTKDVGYPKRKMDFDLPWNSRGFGSNYEFE